MKKFGSAEATNEAINYALRNAKLRGAAAAHT
jgi:hypothetical protein